jgi:hypothetical protein
MPSAPLAAFFIEDGEMTAASPTARTLRAVVDQRKLADTYQNPLGFGTTTAIMKTDFAASMAFGNVFYDQKTDSTALSCQ